MWHTYSVDWSSKFKAQLTRQLRDLQSFVWRFHLLGPRNIASCRETPHSPMRRGHSWCILIGLSTFVCLACDLTFNRDPIGSVCQPQSNAAHLVDTEYYSKIMWKPHDVHCINNQTAKEFIYKTLQEAERFRFNRAHHKSIQFALLNTWTNCTRAGKKNSGSRRALNAF